MIGHFLAAVPGKRLVEFARQALRLPDQRRHDAPCILVGDLDQHHIARMPFDERCDVAVLRAADQIAFPVTGNGAVLDRRGALADRHGILDLAEAIALEAGVPGSADGAPGAQMLQQFLLQNAPRLYVQASVDGFVRHLPVRLLRKAAPEPPRNLFR